MSDKYEREIEDILSRIDKFPRRRTSDRARSAALQRLAALQRHLGISTARLSLSQIMLAGIICIVAGYFLRSILPFWEYLLVGGLILFFASFLLSFVAGRGGRRGSGNYWRGQPVQSYYSSGPTIVDRLRSWWRRRQGRR